MGAKLHLNPIEILRILNSLNLCTNLEAPKQTSNLKFDHVLSVFLKETYQKGEVTHETLPFPVILEEGCHVDLLRLFCVVREKGGYWSVTTSWSWADVAESVDLGHHLGPLVKLVYMKYLSTLESLVQRVKDNKTDPTLDKGLFSLLKRKRDSSVGMLNWVKDLAKKPWDYSNNIIPVLNEAHNGSKQNSAADYFKLAILTRSEIYKKIKKDSSLMSPNSKKIMYASSPNSKNKRISLDTPEKNQTKQSPNNNPPISPTFNLLCIDEKPEIPMGPNHQAVIPNYTKNKSHLDPNILKYLGTRICSPDNPCQLSDISPQKGKIGRKNCECLVPNSIDCVRFHIAENRLSLKLELGPPFYKMGFHKIGEEISLSWREDEEERFKFVIRENSPNEKFDYWGPLKKSFKCKGWRGLVSYYFNVFLVRRRAYQNRLVPDKIDSDDDEIEPGFLDGTCFCVQNSQCMDLDP